MTTATAKKPSLSSVGKLSSLLKKDTNAGNVAAPTGKPLDLPMDRVREDPKQPRTIFIADPHFEKSIAERGVKSPISVRDDPEKGEGYYVINHGAKRYRANAKANRSTIPGFIDNDYTDFDQVIENIHRDGLKARELADFIGGKLAQGMSQKDIAAGLTISQSLVSQHVTLLNLPDPIAEAFNQDRCRDVTVINELVKAHKSKPEEVKAWLDDPTQEITRGTVKLLREYLETDKEPTTDDNSGANGDGEQLDNGDGGAQPTEKPPKAEKQSDPSKMKKAIVQVTHYDRPARLLLDRRPTEIGLAWFKYDDDGEEFEALITEAKLVGLVEGA
jgi:ParB family chromosome partitioning protein